ncbi:MAG TPA: T9SS type A sorting domain-containing protein [Chitinophagaceae bacterium]|nr:T9SS type A sorting domain-containing protein [Chitinophagaceae bacterium]
MKEKIKLVIIYYLFFVTSGWAQSPPPDTRPKLQATITQLSPPPTPTIRASVKSDSNLINTTIQRMILCFSVPDQGINNPTMSLTTLHVPSLFLVGSYEDDYNGRRYYSFVFDYFQPGVVNWDANKGYPLADFTLSNSNGFFPGFRMDDVSTYPVGYPFVQFPPQNRLFNEWGSWYIERLTATGYPDITDYTTKFFGSGSFNGGLYDSSFVPLQSILPVVLKDFKALKEGSTDVKIIWEVYDESNIDKYIIERSIGKPDNWAPIAEVRALNYNTSAITKYSRIDKAVFDNRQTGLEVYYRLKIIEHGIADKYSSVANVKFGSDGSRNSNINYSVNPNPAKNGFYFSSVLNDAPPRTLYLQLIDISGRIRSEKQVYYTGQPVYYDTKDLPRGNYILKVLNKNLGKVETFKILLN